MGWVVAVSVALVVGVLGLVVFRSGTGEVDPAGLLIGLAGLTAAAWSGWISWRAMRWQDTDIAALTDRLAVEVKRQEQDVYSRLPGGSVRTIDVGFAFQPAPTTQPARLRTAL